MTGDGFVAMFDGAERAIHAAQEIGRAASGIGLEIRAAVHTGEIELEGGNVRGAAMHIAARIADLAEPGQVYASCATRLLAGSPIEFTDRGLRELKGLLGRAPRLPGRAVRLSDRLNPWGRVTPVIAVEPNRCEKWRLTRGNSLERMTGIEPALSAWEAYVLPLNYIRLTRHFVHSCLLSCPPCLKRASSFGATKPQASACRAHRS